ncbi:CoA transferase [Gordonia aurantiaca]|uniref:CoA transferase n=1 Tax=Gordonia sp. B21 TaxID=3151852 RepID=UPI0032647BE3
MTEPATRDPSDPVRDDGDAAGGLHRAGRAVAEALGLSAADLAALRPAPDVPTWTSKLRVAELAYDSAALASLGVALIGVQRGVIERRGLTVSPDASKVQASFGSEKLFRLDGEPPEVWGALSGFWRVRDGWVRTHANYPHHAERLARLLGIPPRSERPTVEAAMSEWTRFDLEDLAAAAGALVFAVRYPGEWRQHPQAQLVAGVPMVRFASSGDAAPRPWRKGGAAPLAGIRVLDLTRVIAGPVATRDLAVAGADVLRIDSPRLPEASWQHLDTGHEKRSALMDLDDPSDRLRFEELLSTADVVVHGYRPTALARYGLDPQSLRERFPGIIVAQLSAWGTDGPWGDRRGFDSLVQAASGIAVLESGDGATPGALPAQALDHSTGHFLAAAISTAIRAQRTVGGSFDIDMRLARTAHELLTAGPSENHGEHDGPASLPTTSVPIRPGTDVSATTVICAPPILDFPGAPTNYPSPLHPWGSDEPVWR